MTSVTGSRLIDTSIWLEYMEGDLATLDILNTQSPLFCSVISLFEVRRKLTKLGVSPESVAKATEFMRRRATMIDVTAEIAEAATGYAIQKGLHAIDALIYASARANDALFVTRDNDFRGLPNAIVLN